MFLHGYIGRRGIGMASLALAVVLVMLSVWGLAGVSLILSLAGFRLVGCVFGVLSLVAGLWLLCVLPHAPFLGAVNIAAGGVAVWRQFNRGRHE